MLTMKRIVIGLFSLLVVVLSTVLFIVFNKSNVTEKDLVGNAILLSDIVVGYYKGDNKTGDLKKLELYDKYYSDDILKRLVDYEDALKNLDKKAFNVSEYYIKNEFAKEDNEITKAAEEAGVDVLFEVAEDADYPDDSEENTEEQDLVIENDPRLYEEDGSFYVLSKELDFSNGFDVIAYNNMYLKVNPDEVPQSYNALINDKSNVYTLSTYLVSETGERFIDIKYQSFSSSDKTMIIRVYYDRSNRITDFEVRGGAV